MNDMSERQNANPNNSPPRLTRIRPQIREDADAASEPVREDLDENQEPKAPLPIARRPVPVASPPRPEEGSRGLNILNPPSLARRSQAAQPQPGGRFQPAKQEAPRPNGNRFDSARDTGEAKQDTRVVAPPPVSLPDGIQRGFPRPQPSANGFTRDIKPASAPAPAPRLSISIPEPVREDVNLVEESAQEEPNQAQTGQPERVKDRPAAEFFLEEILDRLANPPSQTALLGVCDDQLPVLIDLNDPAPGALLVVSDDDMLRTRLLRTLVQTSAALNSPRNVQFILFTAQPQEWQSWIEGQEIARHCLSIERLPLLGEDPVTEGSPDRWLVKLASWADQRRSGAISGPAVVLVVDDLQLVTGLEYDARVNFDWLVKEGPRVRIWPVVGLKTSKANELTRWVRLFKTRLIGPAEDAALVRQLSSGSELQVEPAQFAVRVQEDWLKFRVPILPNEVY